MKYIDADSLLAELDTKRKDCLIAHNEFRTDDPELVSFYEGKAKACAELSYYINSLKQEQPSLSSNLDEAAEEYADCNSQRWHEDGDVYYDRSKIMDAFKAGAEWMAEQGISIPAHIFMPCEIKDVYDSSKGEYPAAIHPDCGGSLVLERYLKDFKHNEEVIMQIRKKEE